MIKKKRSAFKRLLTSTLNGFKNKLITKGKSLISLWRTMKPRCQKQKYCELLFKICYWWIKTIYWQCSKFSLGNVLNLALVSCVLTKSKRLLTNINSLKTIELYFRRKSALVDLNVPHPVCHGILEFACFCTFLSRAAICCQILTTQKSWSSSSRSSRSSSTITQQYILKYCWHKNWNNIK